MATKKSSTSKKKVAKASKEVVKEVVAPVRIDLDALAAESKGSVNATDYQIYLRNKLKGIK